MGSCLSRMVRMTNVARWYNVKAERNDSGIDMNMGKYSGDQLTKFEKEDIRYLAPIMEGVSKRMKNNRSLRRLEVKFAI